MKQRSCGRTRSLVYIGTTIVKTFGKCLDGNSEKGKPTCVFRAAADVPHHLHMTDDEMRTALRDYTVFTFVRNPFTRAGSSYGYLNNLWRSNDIKPDKFALPRCNVDFEDYCKDPRILYYHCYTFRECCLPAHRMTMTMHTHP